jgi:hypothetical protein
MDRSELITQITRADSPNDISSAISAARNWLSHHPEDENVREQVVALARQERELLT